MSTPITQFLEYAVEPQAEWQGGVFNFGELASEAFADSPMAEAKIALWVSCERHLVHGKPKVEGTPFDLLISELLEFTEAHNFGYRPASLQVTDKELAGQLQELLAGSGTEVSWNAQPEFLCEVKASMLNHFEDAASAPSAPALADSGCSESQIRAFGEAAAAFYRARPWQFLNDADLLKIQTPKPPKYLKYATLLGSGRREFGLGFYDSPEMHWDMRAQRLDLSSLEVFSLTFNPISEAVQADVAYWQQHDIPLETGDAFPQFLFYSQVNTRPPKPKELEYLAVVLAALANTTEDELDSGEWTKQVSINGKNKRSKISIPDLLDAPASEEWLHRGFVPEPRGNERHLRMIESIMAQHQGTDSEEVSALLNDQLTGPIDEFDYPSATPHDRAENLCCAAIHTYGRRRIQLARQALKEDSTHVETNVLLAESSHDVSQKIDLFNKAIKFGEAQCDEFLKEEAGKFWLISGTRPLIRAKYGLAASLAMDGQANEAIAEMLDILRLNTDDNLGVRHELIPMLLSQDREREATEVLNRYPEETASWLYLKSQVEFRLSGPTGRSAQNAMVAAFESNPHVIECMMAQEPPVLPERYTLGSPEEAAVVVAEQAESWMETDEFTDWMFARFATWQRDSLNP